MTETRLIPLDRLVLDEDYQPRYFTDSDGDPTPVKASHVTALTHSEPDDWPPIVVTPLPDGNYRVIDGFHRVSAARKLELDSLSAVLHEGAGYAEAFEYNMRHGLMISTADRKAFARWLHTQEPDLSLRELGRRAGLSPNTVKAALEDEDGSVQSAHHDNPEKAARRLVRDMHQLWVSPGLFDIRPTRTLGRELAQAALDAWDSGADKMLHKLAVIVAEAREQL